MNFFQFENFLLKNLRDAFLNEPNNIENYKKFLSRLESIY